MAEYEKNKRRIPLQLEALEPRNPPGYLLSKGVIFSGLDDDGFARSSQSLPPPDFTQIESRAVTRSGSALTYETGIPSGVTATQRLAIVSTDAQSAPQREMSVPSSSASNGLGEEPTAAGDLTQNPLDLFMAAMASQPRGGGSAGFLDAAGANQGASGMASGIGVPPEAPAPATGPSSFATTATLGSESQGASAPIIPPMSVAHAATQSAVGAGLRPAATEAGLRPAPQTNAVEAGLRPAPIPRHHDHSDPMWVLDANKAIVVTPGVTEHEFSNWSMSLMAQVSGATVSTYSWNTSSAPDATSISGATTYNLTFTWANFSGAARTDTISVTETPTVGSAITQTLTFLVNSTSSPAYVSTPVTTSSTWPTVLQPDALTDGQATAGACCGYYSAGLTDGEVRTAHMVPSYNPGAPPLGLVYSSAAANPNTQPIFIVHYQLSPSQSVPSTVSAQLTLNSVAASTVYWNTSQLNPGDVMELALQPSNTGLTTNRYSYSISVTANSTTTYSGNVDIINNSGSVFGAGWSLVGLERIWPETGGVILDEGGGLNLWFASAGGGNYTTPPGDTSTLVLNGGTYSRTFKHGTKINFNSSGLQTSIVDTNNNTWTYNYNGSNQLTSISDPYNLNVTFTYTSGLVTSITDPASRTATLTYSSGQLTSWKDPDNALWTYSYDSANHLTALTNPRNNTTTFTYNSGGWVTTVTRPDSTTEQFTPMQSQGLGGTSSSPATPILAAQAQASYIDPRNNTWQTRLDWLGFGKPTQPVDALGNMSLIYRDANGLGWLSADPLARRNRLFFDTLANPTKIVLPDDRTHQFTYNSLSEPLTSTDPNTAVTTYTYDSNGDLTQLTDALSHTTTYTYNSNGFVTSATDPLSHTTTFTYDSRNRLTNRTDPLGHLATYTYDSASDQTSSTNELGYTTTYTYDAMGRVLTKVLPAASSPYPTITYTYDAAGNQVTITDPDSNTTTYGYDALNRVTTMTDALSHSATYSYDNAGNLSAVTDRDGRQQTFTYDADNRRTGETWVNGSYTATYTYNAAGQLTSESDPNSSYAYTYDSDGRLTSVDNNGTPSVPHVVLSYAYDQADNLTSVTDSLSSSGTISYGFDAVHRMTTLALSVAGSQKAQVTFSYDSANRMTGQTRSAPSGTNITTAFGYDNDNHITGITYTANSSTLASFTYTYDNAGEISGYTGPDGTLTYSYDPQKEVLTAGGSSYSYDANGNRNQMGYQTGTDNRLTSDPTYNYTYDNEGNVLTKFNRSNQQQTNYRWDYRNRLTEVVVKSGTGQTLQDDKFTYDVDGKRIGKYTLSGGQTWTVYNGDNTYADFNGSGSLTKRYLYAQAIDELFARYDGSNANWYLTDLLGSVRVITDKSANVLDQITFDGYGNIVSETSPSNGDRFKFTGREWDSEIGLYFYRARYYNPAIGRFISEDPSAFGAGDANLYRYVNNSPTNDADPTGKGRNYPVSPSDPECVRLWERIENIEIDIVKRIVDLITKGTTEYLPWYVPGAKRAATILGHVEIVIEQFELLLRRVAEYVYKCTDRNPPAPPPVPVPDPVPVPAPRRVPVEPVRPVPVIIPPIFKPGPVLIPAFPGLWFFPGLEMFFPDKNDPRSQMI